MQIRDFLENLQLEVVDYNIINQAFVHPTHAVENRSHHNMDNQRLEFLGDAVLGLIVGELLYKRFPKKAEGELTSIRAVAVSEMTLAKIAENIMIADMLLLGKGEEKSGGRYRTSTLADAFEAFLGALYLQMDFSLLNQFTSKLISPIIEEIMIKGYKDPKTQLQEIVQEKYKRNISYRVLEEMGPDHDKVFTSGVVWDEEIIAIGRGKSKKEAERSAATVALEYFGQ